MSERNTTLCTIYVLPGAEQGRLTTENGALQLTCKPGDLKHLNFKKIAACLANPH